VFSLWAKPPDSGWYIVRSDANRRRLDNYKQWRDKNMEGYVHKVLEKGQHPAAHRTL
jgi:hypothetical protein